METPSHFKLLFPREQIRDVTKALGEQITRWAAAVQRDTDRDVLTVPVLRGGIFFFADLVRAIDCSVEVASVQSWNYEVGKNWEMQAETRIDIADLEAEKRSILLVDDICDSGKTLATLSTALRAAGAHEVRSAVLIRRKLEEQFFEPEYIGFEYEGAEWFVGYGMEDRERFRNLPDIYIMEKVSAAESE